MAEDQGGGHVMLLDDYGRKCILLEKTNVPDGFGGYETVWKDGLEFENYQALESSMEARIAEKQGVTSVYNALVKRDLPIEYHSVFRDETTKQTYRVTSDPSDSQAPKSASFDLKFFTAERWALT